jgi:hypothetical protein
MEEMEKGVAGIAPGLEKIMKKKIYIKKVIVL